MPKERIDDERTSALQIFSTNSTFSKALHQIQEVLGNLSCVGDGFPNTSLVLVDQKNNNLEISYSGIHPFNLAYFNFPHQQIYLILVVNNLFDYFKLFQYRFWFNFHLHRLHFLLDRIHPWSLIQWVAQLQPCSTQINLDEGNVAVRIWILNHD